MTGHGLKTLAIAALLAAALIVAGALLPEWMLYTASITLAKGLVVLGLVLLLRMGLVSFGQGMYFCIGAYVCGLLSLWGLSDALVLVLLAGVGSGLVGLVLGLFLSAYRGVFFAMFNLALSMILYGVLLKSISIGGSDGIGVGAPSYFGFVPEASQRPYAFYVFAVLVAVTAGWFARLYTRAETGLASSSARDCEIRLEYLGLSVRRGRIRLHYRPQRARRHRFGLCRHGIVRDDPPDGRAIPAQCLAASARLVPAAVDLLHAEREQRPFRAAPVPARHGRNRKGARSWLKPSKRMACRNPSTGSRRPTMSA